MSWPVVFLVLVLCLVGPIAGQPCECQCRCPGVNVSAHASVSSPHGRNLQFSTDDIIDTVLQRIQSLENTTIGIIDDIYEVGEDMQDSLVNSTTTLYDLVSDKVQSLESSASSVFNNIVLGFLIALGSIFGGLIIGTLFLCQWNIYQDRKKARLAKAAKVAKGNHE